MDQNEEAGIETQELDPVKLKAFQDQMEGEQNLPAAALSGLAAALVGALIWAVVTVLTKYQIGWMAIGIGVLVGLAVRRTGRGISGIFGWLGAVFALLGCAMGNLLSVVGFISINESIPYFEVLKSVFTQSGAVIAVMKATFNPMDLLFYGIAMYEGYGFAFRQITEEELARLAVEPENP